MHFVKWQACGNDFVFINGFVEDVDTISKKTIEICDRHFGIGADGIIFILPSEKADLKMRIFNADGSEAEMCGNGIRALAKWALELELVKKKKFMVETRAGILSPEVLENGLVRVDMGKPYLDPSVIPVTGLGNSSVINYPMMNSALKKTYNVTCISMGNPHCVIFVDDVENVQLEKEGSRLENDSHFPKRTNVEFVQQKGPALFRMRVWERGSGITMACGTGTCATVVAAVLNNKVIKEADVDLDGGRLHIEWSGSLEDHVYMTGPAEKVFEGDYSL